MESLTTEEVFTKLSKQPENTKCIDCSMDEPLWASVNNGVLICNLCADLHRKLGTSVSFVRSIQHDTWTQSYLTLMSIGGNKKFKDFLDVYGISCKEVDEKYPTVAARFYRKQLKAAANNQELQENAPRLNEGGCIVDVTRGEEEEFVEDSTAGRLKGAFSKFGKKIKNSAKEFNEKPKVKEIKEKTQGWFSSVGGKMKEIVQKTKESETYQKVKEKSKVAMQSVTDSAKKTYEKIRKKDEEPDKV
jgi:hypothetical protein